MSILEYQTLTVLAIGSIMTCFMVIVPEVITVDIRSSTLLNQTIGKMVFGTLLVTVITFFFEVAGAYA